MVVNVVGIDLGEFYGSPNDGVVVGVNVIAAKGQVKFFMRNERELWVGPQVDVLFDKRYETEARIV